MDETALIQTACRGDLAAFNEVILSHQNFLFNMAVRILGYENSAADALQETLISAFRNLHTFRGGSIKHWLARILINVCYDELRRLHRKWTIPLERESAQDGKMKPGLWMADPNAGSEESLESHELEQAITTCLQSLPPAYRIVLVLVDVEGQSYEEAAMMMEIPVNTVKSHLSRARMSLREELQLLKDQLPIRYRTDFLQQAETVFFVRN